MTQSFAVEQVTEEILLAQAHQARRFAYAPYSKFKVGAALATRTGAVFVGANVENASYGLTICAERAAVFTAIAAGQRDFSAIALATESATVPVPCGACRQVLAEFNPHLTIISSTTEGEVARFKLSDLLPRANQGVLDKQ